MDLLLYCLISQQLRPGGLAGPVRAALFFRPRTGLGSGVQCLEGQNQACLCVPVLDLGGKESPPPAPLDLLNPLAASQSRQVRLPEPFLTLIPGCAHSRTPWGARGRGSLLLGAEALGLYP